MADSDLDYAKVTGRFGITVGDDSDPDELPEIIYCTSGSIELYPLQSPVKVVGANPVPLTLGNAVIAADINAEGYLEYRGVPRVWVVDLTSEKVNPRIVDDAATHEVRFVDMMAGDIPVTFPGGPVRITAAGPDGDGVNDLTTLLPVLPGAAEPIFQGPRGTSIETASVEGGELIIGLEDGTELNAGELPVGPGGSDAGVADYITTPGTATADALSATIATKVATQTAPLLDVTRSAKAAGQRLRARTAADLRRQVQVTVGALAASSNPSGLETSLGSSTLTNATDLVTTPGAHGLAVGDPIRLTGKTGGSSLNGLTYYVASVPSTTTFSIYASNATSGSTADFGSDGTATVYKFPPLTEQFYSRSLYAVALTIAASSDMFTSASAHVLAVGDVITVASSTAGGVSNDTRYYVKTTPTATTFTVSATLGGATLDVTSDGTATLYRLNPKVVATDGQAVQSTTSSPQNDMVRAGNITSVGGGTTSPTDLSLHTLYDGVAIELLAFNDGAATTYVYADGVLIDTITPAAMSAAGAGSGNSARRLYTFPDAKLRLLTVRSSGVMFGWVRPIAKALYRPSTAHLPNVTRVQITGDSYTEGDYPRWVKSHLRYDNLIKCGSGSTGYKADGTRLALEDRYLTDIIAVAPDVEILAMGLNDLRSTSGERTATVAAATLIWDAITTALPATELVIVGPFFPKGIGTNAVDYRDPNMVLLDAALAAAAKTRGLRYISPVQENWIEGDGKATATTGHGNSDIYISSDGTHPTAAGHEYIGWRLAGHLATPYLPPI